MANIELLFIAKNHEVKPKDRFISLLYKSNPIYKKKRPVCHAKKLHKHQD